MTSSSIFPAAHRGLALGLGLALALPATTGCRKTGQAAEELTQAPTMESATGEAKCGVRKSAAKPLVVEWPAADRAALEARSARGLVAVRYAGCEMEVLTNCTAAGEYEYFGLTQKNEGVKITNADELYAQLPVGAAGLEAKLERAGQLNVDMTIVGRREANKAEFTERDLDGRCDEATHVITGLTVGAFSFYSGASAAVGAGAKVGNIGAGAESSHGQEILKSDGDASACAIASSSDTEPPYGCGALLRVEVVPVDRIFAGHGAGGATASSGGSSLDPRPIGSATSPQDPTRPPADPKIDRKIRNASLMMYSGYLGATGGIVVLAYGFSRYSTGKKALEAEQGTSTVSDSRDDNISKARSGLTMVYVGAAVTGVGLGLGLYGMIRASSLKNQKAASARVAPLLSPQMAGVGISGRF